HPNIVQIHEVGQHKGVTYLVLEYVAGGSLDRLLAGQPQSPQESARFAETLAHAVQHAHDCSVIHRDLKPANVLLASAASSGTSVSSQVVSSATAANARTAKPNGKAGQPPVTGQQSPLTAHQPKITDFGLAKQLTRPGETAPVFQTEAGAIL